MDNYSEDFSSTSYAGDTVADYLEESEIENWKLMEAHLKNMEELLQITRDKFARALEIKEEWDGEQWRH